MIGEVVFTLRTSLNTFPRALTEKQSLTYKISLKRPINTTICDVELIRRGTPVYSGRKSRPRTVKPKTGQ